MLKEFKAFIMRGNVLDMAIGVIIGSAFGKIVSSAVSDIFMPLIGVLVGGINFSGLKIVLTPAVVGSDGIEQVAENALLYGQFLEALVDFLIIASFIFVIIKVINRFKKPAPAEPAAPVEPEVTTNDLLIEIRDLLKADK